MSHPLTSTFVLAALTLSMAHAPAARADEPAPSSPVPAPAPAPVQPASPARPGEATVTERNAGDLVLISDVDPQGGAGGTGSSGKPARVFQTGAATPALLRDATGKLHLVFHWFTSPGQRGQPGSVHDRLVICASADGGTTWTTPRAVRIDAYPSTLARPERPALLATPDGHLRLYFVAFSAGGADRDQSTASGRPTLHSALSRDGGQTWTYEPGPRLPGVGAASPSVARLGNQTILLMPSTTQGAGGGGGGQSFVSDDALAFTSLATMNDGRRWAGALLSSDGQLTFVGAQRGRVWTATSKDAKAWTFGRETAVEATDVAGAFMPDGTLMLAAVRQGLERRREPEKPLPGPNPSKPDVPSRPEPPDVEPLPMPTPMPSRPKW
jgi:hypothetical protein